MKKYTKQLVILSVCVVICGALFLNWRLSGAKDADTVLDERQAKTEEKASGSEKVLGKAEFVSASTEYFDSARMNRKTTRDEAVSILKSVIESDKTGQKEKEDASEKLTFISKAADAEGRIENLVKAKGYAECLAVIGDDTVNVIVQTNGLKSSDVATIKEIASSESEKSAADIKIIESK